MKKYILILFLFLSGAAFSQTYLDSIPTVDNFGRVKNGIIVQGIVDVMNTDPSGVKLTEIEIAYIRSIVGGMYLAGSWQKCVALYGFVGGNAWKHKWNWKDMRDSDEAFRLTFHSSPTHSLNGITFNGISYADTKLLPDSFLNGAHISAYKYFLENTGFTIVGASGVSGNQFRMQRHASVFSNPTPIDVVRALESSDLNFQRKGFQLSSINSLNSIYNLMFGRIMQVSSSASQGNSFSVGVPIFIGKNNSSSIPEAISGTLSFVSIGDGINQEQAIKTSNVVTYSQGIREDKITSRFDFAGDGVSAVNGWTAVRGDPSTGIHSATDLNGITVSNNVLFTPSTGGGAAFANGFGSLLYLNNYGVTQTVPTSVMANLWSEWSNTTKGLLISGLDPSKTYNIKPFGSIARIEGLFTDLLNNKNKYTFVGATTVVTDGLYNFYQNTDDRTGGVTVQMKPNSSGQITIQMQKGVDNVLACIINALEIEEL